MGLKERREREKEARRESILRAARELLHEKGINGASMNQIAKRAELGVATLYSYFKNKEDLFLALQQEGLDLLRDQIMNNLKGVRDPREKLRKIAFAYLDFSRQRKNFYYIINYFISTPEILFEQQMKSEIDLQAEKALQIGVEVVREGIASGVFKDVNPKRCMFMFWVLVQGLTQYRKFETTILKDDNHLEIFEFSISHFIASLIR